MADGTRCPRGKGGAEVTGLRHRQSAVAHRIVRDPRVCGGDPTIAGTRIPVQSIMVSYRMYGNVEQVQQAFPRLGAADVEAALLYYGTHREEIDRLIEENEQAIMSPD